MKDILAKIREHNNRVTTILNDLHGCPLPSSLSSLHREIDTLDELVCEAIKLSTLDFDERIRKLQDKTYES